MKLINSASFIRLTSEKLEFITNELTSIGTNYCIF